MARQNLNEQVEMTFLDHLEVLRWHLMRAVLAVVLLAIVVFLFSDYIFEEIIFAPKEAGFWTNRMLCEAGALMSKGLAWLSITVSPTLLCINTEPLEIYNINMAGQFSTHIRISLLLGLVLAFPYVFWEMWRFIKPALYDKEVKHSRGAIFYTSGLFMAGVLFGYYLITPLTIHFLGSYQVSSSVANEINLNSYISTLSSVVLAAGIVFELPVMVYFLAKIGLVSAEFLRKYRRHSIIVILLLSAIITPPDVFSQLLVGIPLVILYEVSIKITRRIERKRMLEAEGLT